MTKAPSQLAEAGSYRRTFLPPARRRRRAAARRAQERRWAAMAGPVTVTKRGPDDGA